MAIKEYEESLKKSLVVLYLRGIKVDTICKENGILRWELYKWIKEYSEDNLELIEVKNLLQIRNLKKQKLDLEVEVLFLNEAISLLESP
ncbi:helix-turn-helix domain-containing protein [Listeria monocytogenes]|uniref:helix-turn-helix domain-containing protein n=1 Tax=Listeria innocua TaxID=1642 RepID=UPI0010AF279A|nr:helix-turn-helix domain-containing protein [Listeria innocua]EAC9723818.1 helix-turn-helix domain-containing protein [Listeria monocytogenes]EAD4858715.1 helix-turn-helix domain-containing protein [Listeria monocytogenes]EAF5119915.1 helix-turn-helix domain-containing protein [Listeria monocytogenes]EAG1603937.1 helix-turn-helix domain-containing protein [Listeria monocytogenes]EAG7075098.1 helix-turn-helix domain-containing protein [Listeria monocytogenes]